MNSWQISEKVFVSEYGRIHDMAMPGWASPRPQSLAFFSQLPTVSMQLSLARGAGVNSLQRLQPVCQQQQLSIAIASAGGRSCASGLDTCAYTCVLISLPPFLHLQLLLSNSEVALQSESTSSVTLSPEPAGITAGLCLGSSQSTMGGATGAGTERETSESGVEWSA